MWKVDGPQSGVGPHRNTNQKIWLTLTLMGQSPWLGRRVAAEPSERYFGTSAQSGHQKKKRDISMWPLQL